MCRSEGRLRGNEWWSARERCIHTGEAQICHLGSDKSAIDFHTALYMNYIIYINRQIAVLRVSVGLTQTRPNEPDEFNDYSINATV